MEIMGNLASYFRNFAHFSEGTKENLLRAYNACKNLMDDEDLSSFMFALYYFCSDYHSGQSSFFYQISSNMRIKTYGSIDSEGEDVQMLYSALEAEFGHKPTF
jgi:hypothetical protein